MISFPLVRWIRCWLIRLCIRIIKSGPIPKHIAVIMDGNRRFAKRHGLKSTKGHELGADKMLEVFDWSLDFGIEEMTVYAFSIENFKRSAPEVERLLNLMKEVSNRLLYRIRIDPLYVSPCFRMFGKLSLLPQDVQDTLKTLQDETKHNTGVKVNMCVSYTSREEISAAVRVLAEGVSLGLIRETDVTEDLMSKCLYTRKSRDPDLLIRTSGEVRLSDFLLWQTTYSCLCFLHVLWPAFTIWHMVYSILWYQRTYQTIKCFREKIVMTDSSKEKDARENQSKDWIQQSKRRVEQFLHYVKVKGPLIPESI